MRREVEAPGKRDDAFVVALDGERAVGYAALGFGTNEPHDAWHDMTGVLRSHRGRGIASALKRAQIRWAKQNGISRLVTGNHEDNAPIRHLNDALGYRPTAVRVLLRGPIVD